MNKELIEILEGEIVVATTFEQDITTIKDITTKAFLITGKILQNIQDDKKYKEAGYKTFAKAVKSELGLESRRAYQLIDACNVYQNVNHGSQNLPTAERQLRPLAKLLPKQQIEVWQEVAKDKVPTAKEVTAAVKAILQPVNKKESKKVTIPIVVDNTIVKELEKEVKKLNKEIKILKEVCIAAATIEAELNKYREKYGKLIEQPKRIVRVNTITRAELFEFIHKHGNNTQRDGISMQNLSDKQMFNIFVAVRDKYLSKNPPQSLAANILDATEIVQ